jgi:hypothetical protein
MASIPVYQFDHDGLPMLDDLSHDEIKEGFKVSIASFKVSYISSLIVIGCL